MASRRSGEIVDFITAYADFIAAPIRCGVAVTALRRRDGASGFVAETSDGPIEADNVVVATGPYQRPVIPALLRDDVDVFQVHASRYQNPGQLPPGAVLVVGSGASGAQIAEELLRAGRRVYLSVGRHRRMPRRYRGRDLIWWLSDMGLDQTPAEQRGPSRSLPVITGAYGGHTIDFRRFAADGVTLLGRVQAARDGIIDFAPISPNSLADRRRDLHHLPRHGGCPCRTPRPATCRRIPPPARCCRIRPASPNRCGGSISAPPASAR